MTGPGAFSRSGYGSWHREDDLDDRPSRLPWPRCTHPYWPDCRFCDLPEFEDDETEDEADEDEG